MTKLLVVFLSFAMEFIDSTLGMGYGTTLTPTLLLFGFEPKDIVTAILFSECFTGIFAGIAHHFFGNVSFKVDRKSISQARRLVRTQGRTAMIDQVASRPVRIAAILMACSFIGMGIAVFSVLYIPKEWIKLYIAILVTAMGASIIILRKKKFAFSRPKLVGLSLVAGFNKGVSGGGYGPIVASGQMIAGVPEKEAIGITSITEGLTCAIGFLLYRASGNQIPWGLVLLLTAGSILSVPLSAFTVKKMHVKWLKGIIGAATMGLGIYSLLKLYVL